MRNLHSNQKRKFNHRHPVTRFRAESLEDRRMLAFTVANLDDSGEGSLRAAIEQANATPGPDTIEFAAEVSGAVQLTSGQLAITDDVVIMGPGAEQLTVQGQLDRIFLVDGARASFHDLSIVGGVASDFPVPDSVPDPGTFAATAAGGGLLNIGGHVTLDHVHFAGNVATNNALVIGGAIANVFGASLEASHVSFVQNQALGLFFTAGGAILNDAASEMHISHGVFTGNVSATLLGGSAVDVLQGAAVGGAVTNAGGSHMHVTQSSFETNFAFGGGGPGDNGSLGGGGGILNSNNSLIAPPGQTTLTVVQSRFVGNGAIGGDGVDGIDGQPGAGGGQGNGGALNNDFGATMRVVNTLFEGNVAQGGSGGNGAIGADGGSSGTIFDNNASGGAIFNVGSSLNVTRGTFNNNLAIGGAGGNGGAGGRGADGADAQGGAISNAISFFDMTLPSTVVVNQSSFHANRAIGGAGGIGDAGDGVGGTGAGGALHAGTRADGEGRLLLSIKNSVIDANFAIGGGSGGDGLGGGIFVGVDAIVSLKRTTITENVAIGAAGRPAGLGVGGGVYSLGKLEARAKDLDEIFGNVADLFPDLFDDEL